MWPNSVEFLVYKIRVHQLKQSNETAMDRGIFRMKQKVKQINPAFQSQWIISLLWPAENTLQSRQIQSSTQTNTLYNLDRYIQRYGQKVKHRGKQMKFHLHRIVSRRKHKGIATLPRISIWLHTFVLSCHPHQPESHQLSQQKVLYLLTFGPIDRTPGLSGSDKKIGHS